MALLLAVLPILLFTALLVQARWSAAAAGLAGAVCALALALDYRGIGRHFVALSAVRSGVLAASSDAGCR